MTEDESIDLVFRRLARQPVYDVDAAMLEAFGVPVNSSIPLIYNYMNCEIHLVDVDDLSVFDRVLAETGWTRTEYVRESGIEWSAQPELLAF